MAKNDPELERLGSTIRALRIAYGWRATTFAGALGISPAYLSNIEAGRKKPPADLLRRIADAIPCELGALVSQSWPQAVPA
jgi:transcriptional regulator with XRE-family HTH domain